MGLLPNVTILSIPSCSSPGVGEPGLGEPGLGNPEGERFLDDFVFLMGEVGELMGGMGP